MKFFLLFIFVLLLLLTDEASAKKSKSSKTRSRPTNSGSGGKTTNPGNSDYSSSNSYNSYSSSSKTTNQQYASGNYQGNQKIPDSKSSYPTVESQYNRKQTSQYQQSAANQQNSPVGWNIPGQANNNYAKKDSSTNIQRNPAWNSANQQQNSPGAGWNIPGQTGKKDAANSPSKGWTSGYQSSGPKRDEGLVKKQTAGVQQSIPNQPQPPQPGWNVGGQNNAPNTNSGWKSGYQTHGAPPAYPHQNAAPPGYNGQTSWGAPPAYSAHGAPGGYNGFGHQQPSGYGGYGGHGGYGGQGGYGGHGGYGGGYGGGYHPQQSVGGYNPGYGGMSMGGGGFGGFGGGGFGSPGGYYPMQKKSFFSASTIGSVVAGMLVYNMASSLISHGLGLKRPYTVVNYYNQEPGKKVEEIKLPANVLTLCDSNVNTMCGQGTQSVCTQNGTVLCVATMNQATPCNQNGNSALCVNTTVPCVDANDPLCQNSTQKDKLQAEVNVPCFTNLTLDVNLVDKDQTLPNTKYTYCVTTMAVAGPEYKLCEELKDSNDYRSVLNGNHEWLLETDGFKRNYSIYNFEKPMESNGEINMPVTVLVKCSENAKTLCPPGTIATCTTFNEVMCMASTKDVQECPEKNTTCFKSSIPCPEGSQDKFCQSKSEGAEKIDLDIPCFANVTFNAPFPKFELGEFNGTLPDLTATSSYTFNFHYCVMTLALPGTDFDLCITKEAKEKQEKEKGKT